VSKDYLASRAKAKLASINTVLPSLVAKFGLDRRLQEQALFSLWPSLVDPIYANRSIPIFIDEQRLLVIAVENGSVAQELSFLKTKLLAKLQPLALALGFTIKGMRFDLKSFSKYSQKENITLPSSNEVKNLPSQEDLSALELTVSEKEELEALQEGLNKDCPNYLRDRILTLAEKSMRLKKWHRHP
jgi:hypothetical protein